MTAILGYVTSIFTTVLSVGSSLIDWMTTSGNEIALIPIALMILVFAVGAIRKLIRGI